MAYLKEQNENLEISYPLNAISETIPKAIEKLDWKIREKNERHITLLLKLEAASLLIRPRLKLTYPRLIMKQQGCCGLQKHL